MWEGFRESRRWLFEEPTQSQISTSILKYTTSTHQRARDTPPSSASLGLTDYSQVDRSNLAPNLMRQAPRICAGLMVGGDLVGLMVGGGLCVMVGGDLCVMVGEDLSVAARGGSHDVALRHHLLVARSVFSPTAKHRLHFCIHPGVELRANLKSISHRCHLFEVAFVWELTKETIVLPLGCLQGGPKPSTRGGRGRFKKFVLGSREFRVWQRGGGVSVRTASARAMASTLVALPGDVVGPETPSPSVDPISPGTTHRWLLLRKTSAVGRRKTSTTLLPAGVGI